jgi:multimeric flavodoxin WrbA
MTGWGNTGLFSQLTFVPQLAQNRIDPLHGSHEEGRREMRILMISGSRNPQGQTARMAEALLCGAREYVEGLDSFFLPMMDIERCRQCEDNGWGICLSEGTCIIEDDFAGLVDQIRAADGLVFANPVYYHDLSESLRAFLDRLRRVCFNEYGRQGIADKPAIGICVAGGSGNGTPACGYSLEKALLAARLAVADMVLARRQNLDLKERILEETGKWFAVRLCQDAP